MKEKIGAINEWMPVNSIQNGYVYLKSKKIIKILEVVPINFRLKTIQEQQTIIFQYQSFLKSSDFDIQIAIQTKPADVSKYKEKYIEIYNKEKNEKIKEMLIDYIEQIKSYSRNQSISRKFYMIISLKGNDNSLLKNDVEQELSQKTIQIKENLFKCGNMVYEIADFEIEKMLYSYLNKKTSKVQEIFNREKMKNIIF